MKKCNLFSLGISLFLLGNTSISLNASIYGIGSSLVIEPKVNVGNNKDKLPIEGDINLKKNQNVESLATEKEKKIKEIELVFIIDMSGSMEGSEDKVVKGFEDMVKEQKTCDDGRKVNLTTVLFNTKEKVLHNQIDIEGISKITTRDYRPSGCTALFDAIGNTVNLINDKSDEKYVICVIITDGYENSSRKFSQQQIKDLIKEKESQGNWKFLYLMSGIDLNKRSDIGVNRNDCMSFESSAKNADVSRKMMSHASMTACDCRASLR